jgi:hypothetical protein
MKLYEAEHPYYCNLGNYFCGDAEQPRLEYKSFEEFLSEWNNKETDFDYNLLFRWDWREENPETGKSSYTGDDYYRNGTLELFWILQRKGIYLFCLVDVCRADEPAVRAYLEPRWEYMKSLWEGIT